MPVTVPRASVTEATDDLKARDALLRRFPEVEMIVGKAGRADTPTDPSPLDMVESVITLRPKEYWPKRKLEYKDAERQTAVVLAALQDRGLIEPIREESERRAILDPATMNATMRMDEAMRELVLRQFSRVRGGPGAEVAARVHRRIGRPLAEGRPPAGGKGDRSNFPERPGGVHSQKLDLSPFPRPPGQIIGEGIRAHPFRRRGTGRRKSADPAHCRRLAAEKKVELNPDLLTAKYGPLYEAYLTLSRTLGVERPTLFTDMWDFLENRRDRHWREAVSQFDRRIFDQAVAAYDRYAIEELHKLADEKGLWEGSVVPSPGGEGRPNRTSLRAELDAAWSPHLFLWKKSKDDLLKEMDSVVRMPGWANIWTQPIINRIDMLATGVRTMIGVKVFGNDLDQNPDGVRPGRRGAAADSRSGGRVSRPNSRQGLPGNQDRPRSGGPLRRKGRRHSGRDRNGTGRKGRSP